MHEHKLPTCLSLLLVVAAAAAHHAGFADDYALLIAGLLDLYECGGGLQWLQFAVELQEVLDNLFWDPAGG
jgi:uncharacterized protein YyaL (SSP411 family)